MTFGQLSDEHLDALREISNVGMGHAATALSQMVGDTIYLHVPKVSLADIAEVPELMGGADTVVVGVTLQIRGDATGTVLLVFPEESALRLARRLLGRSDDEDALDAMGNSTLMEVGNILASSYLGAMGSLLHLMLLPSIPLLAHDMAGAVIDYLLIELSEAGNQALVIETEFHGKDPQEATIAGHFFLLPDPESLGVLIEAIGAAR